MQHRMGYQDWRRGKGKGCKNETSDISGYRGWRFDKPLHGGTRGPLAAADDYEHHNEIAGLLWTFSQERCDRERDLRTEEIERKIAALTAELQRVRAQHPKQLRWADEEPDGCLAEANSPQRRWRGPKAPQRSGRPISRRHIHGEAHPATKLTAPQI